MAEQDYLTLVRSQDLDSLDKAWQEALADPGDVLAYRQTIEELCDSDSLGVALSLATPMVQSLSDKGRIADAVTLASAIVARGAHDESMVRTLFDLLQQQYSGHDWFPVMLELSGLGPDKLTPEAFASFDRMVHFTPGHVLYHRAGWNEGVIESMDCGGRELVIRFADGRLQEFPLTSALESLRPLDDDDLRAMRLLQPDELQRLAAEEPTVLIRKAAAVHRGRITSTQVKGELCPSVIPTKKWASFWKRAKSATTTDPWLKIEGSSTRPVFELRKKPLSLADEAGLALRHSSGLAEAIAVCRDYLARGIDERGRGLILDMAQERIEGSLERQDESPAHLLDGILMLEELGRQTSVSAAEELRAMLLNEDGSLHPEAFDALSAQEAREHAVTLLDKALGPQWAEMCIASISRFPASVVEHVVDLLHESGNAAALASHWKDVAPYPRRHAILTYLLGRLFAEGVFDGSPQKPDVITVGRVMLHLARVTAKERKSNPVFTRLRSRLTSLLVGRRALLDRSLEDIGRDDLAAYLGIAERGGQDFPPEITTRILRTVAIKYPDITSKPERPFWENEDSIFVTAEGLARLQEQYRQLVDVKIPANSKAIGAAASMGDLSENSEWEAAMEEQRNLTGRADLMDKDLRRARLIEDQVIPDGVVTPGTKVSFTYTDVGQTAEFKIVGPWDCVEETTINYLAPIAAAFLGQSAGNEITLDSPEGPRTVRIDRIEKIV